MGSSGQLLESLGFDAWGKRRYASGQTDAANPGIAGQTTDRGYTGHEHLDELGLINMNARIYDPLLGRFLSPDPEVTDEERMQNYNRYAYVMNNPLSYTDPSGETWKEAWDKIKEAVGKMFDGWGSKSSAVTDNTMRTLQEMRSRVIDSGQNSPTIKGTQTDTTGYQMALGAARAKCSDGCSYRDQLEDMIREVNRASLASQIGEPSISTTIAGYASTALGVKVAGAIVETVNKYGTAVMSKIAGMVAEKFGKPAKTATVIEKKIAKQMAKRGWTTEAVNDVIENPAKTVVTKDTRFDPVTGKRLNEPATGYV